MISMIPKFIESDMNYESTVFSFLLEGRELTNKQALFNSK